MGTENCKGEDPLAILEEACKFGITCFQLREKGNHSLKGEDLVNFALRCKEICHTYGVPFIVNDFVELALEVDADGIHVGQDDASLREIREKFQEKIIGVSVHNEKELVEAVKGGADYVGIGPIYETKSKLDAEEVCGVNFLTKARELFPDFSIVGIGGITPNNVLEVLHAGADGVAVISAICESKNRQETIFQLKCENKVQRIK